MPYYLQKGGSLVCKNFLLTRKLSALVAERGIWYNIKSRRFKERSGAMADSKFILPGPESVSMSGDAARRLIGCGSGDAALLYLYILMSGGRYDRADAASRIGRSETQVEAALAVLTRLGLVDMGGEEPGPRVKERADELPEYTLQDIQRQLDSGEGFKSLVQEVQHALGKLLSSDDLKRLFGIYDYLGLPADVILQLVIHCREECRRTRGPGRGPTMRYIEKAAYTWEREGIFSLEAAENYIKRAKERQEARDSMAQALNIQGRPLSPSERKYLDGWAALGFGPEAVAIAYDRTVLKTGGLTWRYMDSIIRSWHSKGLHTPEEIAAGDGPRYQSRPSGSGQERANTYGSPSREELESMRRALRDMKGDE